MQPRRRAETTAFGRPRRALTCSASTRPGPTRPTTERNIAWTRALLGGDARRSRPAALYLNFAGFGEEKEALVRAAYGPNYERLAALKDQVRPDQPLPHEPEHPAIGRLGRLKAHD